MCVRSGPQPWAGGTRLRGPSASARPAWASTPRARPPGQVRPGSGLALPLLLWCGPHAVCLPGSPHPHGSGAWTRLGASCWRHLLRGLTWVVAAEPQSCKSIPGPASGPGRPTAFESRGPSSKGACVHPTCPVHGPMALRPETGFRGPDFSGSPDSCHRDMKRGRVLCRIFFRQACNSPSI